MRCLTGRCPHTIYEFERIFLSLVDTQCVSKVELSISRSNLLNKDVGSKSGPLCVMMQSIGNDKCFLSHYTVGPHGDPEFSKKLLLDYRFERSVDLNDDDFLGGKKLTRPLQMKKGKPAGKGIITITAEEIKDNRDIVLELEAKGLDKKDLFGKSYPFLEFFKQEDDGKWQLVHRTEVIKNNLSPSWKKFSVALQTFCNCDHEQTNQGMNSLKEFLKVTCYDKDKDTSSDIIGEFTCTTAQLLNAKDRPGKKKKKSSKNSGVISVKCCQVGFLYFSKVGIDFTGSNGDPRSPQSLHFLSPDVLNQYLAATWSVGRICLVYLIVFIANRIKFNKLFCPLLLISLSNTLSYSSSPMGRSQTLDQTRDAIVKASRLPMSIIIIGVGEANFKAMELLDGDEGILKSLSGEPVARDIVQFVPFRQFANDPKDALAQSVLAEVPSQLVSYFKMLKLDPVNVAAIKT
uniref:Copine I n=1 Tax=Oncorhynchus kisutch TaxID=8019 RepID=A0A8C7HZ35_ONCKI